ncbi:MAG TPA: TonB-dependent receptor plug domain-containing protein, partial [Prosthecobacter sp.]|nr:TonB-dependent receptor plug domain-containing protein [Prosthecobacter sp.]
MAFFCRLAVAVGFAIQPLHSQPSAGDPYAGMEVEELEDVVVIAEELAPAEEPASRGLDVARLSIQPVSELSGEVLRRRAQGTLGETLSWEPGVSSGYFGPGSSRPVIRGFDGFRVKMMLDHLSTMDVSDISPDHGIAIEPLLAEAIEVHRGPAALLYGNAAIGGAVNTRSRVIARALPATTVSGSLDSRLESVSEGWAQTGFVSLAHAPWVVHLTGSIRESEDIRIPGLARTIDYDIAEQPRVFNPGTGASTP